MKILHESWMYQLPTGKELRKAIYEKDLIALQTALRYSVNALKTMIPDEETLQDLDYMLVDIEGIDPEGTSDEEYEYVDSILDKVYTLCDEYSIYIPPYTRKDDTNEG